MSEFDDLMKGELEGTPLSEKEEKPDKKKEKELKISFWENEDILLEQVYKDNKHLFLAFDKKNKDIGYVDDYKDKGITIKPVNWDIITKKMILLPSSPVDYKNEEELDNKIISFIHKWLDIEDFYQVLCLYYIKMSWIYDRMTVVPYLRAMADYGSGKTRFIQTVGSLCYKPMFLAGASSDSFLFRIIETFKGTLVINELERINTDIAGQIVNILNNGYEKGMGVGRTEGDKEKTPTIFDVFSPKLMSTREPFKDLALESRILSINLLPTTRKDIPILLDESFWIEAENIRNMLLSYRLNAVYAMEQKRRGSGDIPKTRKHGQNVVSADATTLPTLTTGEIGDDKMSLLLSLEPRTRQTFYPLMYVIPNNNIKEFSKYAHKYEQQIIMDRYQQIDAVIALKIIEYYENPDFSYSMSFIANDDIEAIISLKDLRKEINSQLDDDTYKISPQKLGKVVKSLGFETARFGVENMTCIVKDAKIIEKVKTRYDIGGIPGKEASKAS